MDSLSVIATKAGSIKPEKIGEIDRGDFSYSNGSAYLDLTSSNQIVKLLGAGFMTRGFHLVDGDAMLVNCRIVGRGGTQLRGGSRIEYPEEQPARKSPSFPKLPKPEGSAASAAYRGTPTSR